ncbi:MAG: NAD(P)/FAD-dependent oxidoreductase [Bacteroidota bacterium]
MQLEMKDRVSIVGAGLVGSLLGLLLKQKGFNVELFEKRKDPRKVELTEGRSINLALSRRGILPLKASGIYEKIAPHLIPMHGRMMHDQKGNLTTQPYGKQGQSIYSVSRAHLNEMLIQLAEEEGVQVHFNQKCKYVDFDDSTLYFDKGKEVRSDLIVGADGAFSVIRKYLQNTDRFNFSQHFIEHGYKELTIYPINDDFALEPNYLHIWPRGNFMLIALPNNDKTFTCTLFFPFEGPLSFASLGNDEDVITFFENYFCDTIKLIPDLANQFKSNPTSSLIMTKCFPWHNNNTILLGDAAHAIVPFYGQGMNAGFEDVRIFVEQAEKVNFKWRKFLKQYSITRKKDADAISDLALHNFLEMRDHVANPNFLKRKELETKIQEAYPEEWIPLYSMVTFSDLPYSEALRLGKVQTRVLEEFLSDDSKKINFEKVIKKFKTLQKIS